MSTGDPPHDSALPPGFSNPAWRIPVVLTGAIESEGELRADPGLRVIRARSMLDAIAEIAELARDPARQVETVVLFAPRDATAPTAEAEAHAIQMVDPRAILVGIEADPARAAGLYHAVWPRSIKPAALRDLVFGDPSASGIMPGGWVEDAASGGRAEPAVTNMVFGGMAGGGMAGGVGVAGVVGSGVMGSGVMGSGGGGSATTKPGSSPVEVAPPDEPEAPHVHTVAGATARAPAATAGTNGHGHVEHVERVGPAVGHAKAVAPKSSAPPATAPPSGHGLSSTAVEERHEGPIIGTAKLAGGPLLTGPRRAQPQRPGPTEEASEAVAVPAVPAESLPGDAQLLAAVLRGQDPTPAALRLIAHRLGRRECRFEPAPGHGLGPTVGVASNAPGTSTMHGGTVSGSGSGSGSALSSSPAATVRLGGQVLGRLVLGPALSGGAAASRSELTAHAAWLSGWLRLHHQQRELRREAYTDPLTGAWNRRYCSRFLDWAIERVRAARHSLTVLYFDIDGFKVYNDLYGHEAGDAILVETVRALKSVIRPHDRVCRIGGDEFVVVFFEPDGPRRTDSRPPESVYVLTRRVQQKIIEHEFPKLGREAAGRLTISGGLATFPWDGDSAAALLRRADELAIQSKRQGKNAITLGPGAERACDPNLSRGAGGLGGGSAPWGIGHTPGLDEGRPLVLSHGTQGPFEANDAQDREALASLEHDPDDFDPFGFEPEPD